jgi:hypothetical protein
MSVSGPTTLPGGQVSSYTVTITSSIVCFPASEPIDLYTLGNPNASALSVISPPGIPPQDKNHYRFTVDPGTHTAMFNLEAFNAALDASGLGVKAVWPQEGIERVSSLIAPTAPTSTATPVPTQATPSATATPGTTAGAGAPTTATATATPTGTPAPTAPLVLRTCVDPNPVPGGGTATLYGQTTPGAVCNAGIRFNDNTSPQDFGPQTALSDGFVVFPFTASKTAGSGTATVSCTLGAQSQSSNSFFLVSQGGATNPSAGTLPVSAGANPQTVASGDQLTISAQTTPGAQCVARIVLSATEGIPFNGYVQTVPSNGLISWTFTVQTQGIGQASAIVDCILGTMTGESIAGFTVA